jgi:hypothetical protein
MEENEGPVNGFQRALAVASTDQTRARTGRNRNAGRCEWSADSDTASRGAGGASARPIEGVREAGGADGGVNAAAGACGCGPELRPLPERRGSRSRRGLLRPPREPSRPPSRVPSLAPSLAPSRVRGSRGCSVSPLDGAAAGPSPTCAAIPLSARGMVCPISFSIATMDF